MSQFNIGSDAVLTFLVNGTPIGSMLLTKFTCKQKTSQLVSKPVNKDPSYRENEEGWEGTLEYDRSTPDLDDFFAAKEAARYAGQAPPSISINYSIKNARDGSTSKYRLEGVAVKLDDAGTIAEDEKVTQSVGWTASRRKKAQ